MLFRAGFPGRQFPAGVGSSGPPLIDFDFTKGSLPDSRMTFARASSATYFDSNGVMQTAGNNVLRFDNDPVTRAPLGVYLEQSTTNLMFPSGDLATLFTTSSMSVTSGAGVAPDGTNTMARLVEGATTNVHYGQRAFTATASANYAVSFFCRAVEDRYIQLFYDDNSNGVHAAFDLVAGTTLGIATHGTGATGLSASIQPIGNSIFRCSIVGNAAASTAVRSGIVLCNTYTNSFAPSYAGNTANGILAWGAQTEQWNFATSYIPTVGGTVTRAADDLRLPALLPASVFSAFAEWMWEGTNPNEHRIIGTVPSSAGIIYCHQTAGAGIYDGGTVVHTNTVPNPNFIFNRAASSYNYLVKATAVLNGSAPAAPYTPGSTGFTGGTALRFMSGGTTLEASNGWLKRFKWWTRALSDGELQALTTDPTLDIGFIDPPGGLDPRISFTRASTGTYTDIDRLMKTANSGVPRFDHDPVTAAPLGLLIEEARTNQLFPSGDMFGLFGNPTNGTFSSSPQLAPNNTQTMSRLSPNSSSSNHYTQKLFTVTASATYALSIYAKAQELVYLQLYYDDGSSNGCHATFDVLNGVVSGPVASRGTGTGIAATIQPAGNGIYRCTLVGIAGSATAARCGVILAPGPNLGFAPAFVGDPSTGLLIWGAQIEQGAFSTSYIPTVGSGATRQTDLAIVSVGSWFNPAVGSIALDLTTTNIVSPSRSFSFSDGTTNNLLEAFYAGATTLSYQQIINGTTTTFIINSTLSAGANKVALAYAAGAQSSSFNGGAIVSAALAGVPVGLNSLAIGNRFDGVRSITGWVRRVRYWPRALSNADLIAAST